MNFERQFHGLSLLALTVSPSWADSLTPAKGAAILVPGFYYGQDVTVNQDALWLGLFRTGNTAKLKITRLRIEPAIDEAADMDSNGKKISAVNGDAVFLVPHELQLKPGPVTEATFANNVSSIAPATLHLLGSDWQMTVEQTGKTTEGIPKERLVLTRGSQSQVVYAPQFPYTVSAEILWAGDADHDGKLDVVLRITDNDIGSFLYLFFLSSAGQPFGANVAQWRTSGD